jgi:hypothetical protein
MRFIYLLPNGASFQQIKQFYSGIGMSQLPEGNGIGEVTYRVGEKTKKQSFRVSVLTARVNGCNPQSSGRAE